MPSQTATLLVTDPAVLALGILGYEASVLPRVPVRAKGYFTFVSKAEELLTTIRCEPGSRKVPGPLKGQG